MSIMNKIAGAVLLAFLISAPQMSVLAANKTFTNDKLGVEFQLPESYGLGVLKSNSFQDYTSINANGKKAYVFVRKLNNGKNLTWDVGLGNASDIHVVKHSLPFGKIKTIGEMDENDKNSLRSFLHGFSYVEGTKIEEEGIVQAGDKQYYLFKKLPGALASNSTVEYDYFAIVNKKLYCISYSDQGDSTEAVKVLLESLRGK